MFSFWFNFACNVRLYFPKCTRTRTFCLLSFDFTFVGRASSIPSIPHMLIQNWCLRHTLRAVKHNFKSITFGVLAHAHTTLLLHKLRRRKKQPNHACAVNVLRASLLKTHSTNMTHTHTHKHLCNDKLETKPHKTALHECVYYACLFNGSICERALLSWRRCPRAKLSTEMRFRALLFTCRSVFRGKTNSKVNEKLSFNCELLVKVKRKGFLGVCVY